ncbi:MAG TPA: ABC transporter ATP-binding protein [Anaerolineae bacterium]|mgnify:CR=1 FL=1|nr:ABC transporter ATP-binding protein [Anaerolineae bacterium]HQK15306.1 ABC transporter ATP-binding protein [Anaerolineae bacterium]
MSEPVLRVKNLKVYYYVEAGAVKAVDDVSFELDFGVKMGLVGESGSGKSTMALALMRMIKPPGKIVGGQMILGGTDLVKLNEEQMRQLRLSRLAMIPQGAMNSLNPVMRIDKQLIDGMLDHNVIMSNEERVKRVNELLEMVDLPPKVAKMYPHELSGGMQQRVTVAQSISMEPDLIIADEPTSALDVVIQRQVMETINRLQQRLGLSVILIGHDMGLMAQTVDRLAVMYAGRMMEIGETRAMFHRPLHPYTELLIKSLPVLENKGVFSGIPGITPSLLNPPAGCVFHTRCPKAWGLCEETTPQFVEAEPGRWVACHLITA